MKTNKRTLNEDCQNLEALVYHLQDLQDFFQNEENCKKVYIVAEIRKKAEKVLQDFEILLWLDDKDPEIPF